MIARRAVVHGKVQGVFFRAHVQEVAEGEGVAGWAANRADGTVEVHAEGDAVAVEQVLGACRSGSRSARVEHVEVADVPPQGCAGFVRR